LLADAKGDLLGYQIDTRKSALAARTDQSRRRTAANKSRASRDGIPTVMADDTEQFSRALELLGDSPRRMGSEVEITEGMEP